MPATIDDTARVLPAPEAYTDLSVGYCSVVGAPGSGKHVARIGPNVSVGRFCIIEDSVEIGSGTAIDDYCAIYSGAQVGENVKLLYGKKIYPNAVVGDNSIIGGNVPERAILAPFVTFMGEVAHSHHDASLDWDTTDEPSPTIGVGSVVGLNALLVGGISIGDNCYVGAGEVLRHDLPSHHVFLKASVYPLAHFRGLLRTRYLLADG